jgi:hypothetical protein
VTFFSADEGVAEKCEKTFGIYVATRSADFFLNFFWRGVFCSLLVVGVLEVAVCCTGGNLLVLRNKELSEIG